MTTLYALNIRDPIRPDIWEDFLSETPAERREQAGRYRFPKDERRCICAHALFRYAYTRGTGQPATAARVLRNPWGKPYLVGEAGCFNLSHSGDWVVCAWSGSPVGADVECIGETDPSSSAQWALHPAEYRHVAEQVDPGRKRELFCQYWTLKESYVKYRGLGLSLPPDSFRILLDDDEARLLAGWGVAPAFFRYRLDREHMAAVCAEEGDRVPLYTLTPGELHSQLQKQRPRAELNNT